jgi:flagellar basal-body rod modification protein FlgD
MQIPGISSQDPLSLGGANDSSALDKDAFMELLATQLKHQDPMAPTDNSQMIAQLAQFSSLEQMQQVNDNLIGLAVLQQTNALLQQMTSSAALIGQEVRYIDPQTEAEASGVVGSVLIKDGLAQLQIDGKDVPLANVIEISAAAASTPAPDPDADVPA